MAQAPGFARYFEILFRYILQVHDIPKDEIVNLAVKALKQDVREAIMTIYEQLIEEGKQLGIMEGKQLGIREERKRILIRLLSKRFHIDIDCIIPLLKNLSPEQQEELSDKILEARSLKEIEDWISSVRQN